MGPHPILLWHQTLGKVAKIPQLHPQTFRSSRPIHLGIVASNTCRIAATVASVPTNTSHTCILSKQGMVADSSLSAAPGGDQKRGVASEPLPESSSLYDVLDVSRTASTSEIRKAYHKAALMNHPDKNPGDRNAEKRFRRIAQAYEILGDSNNRARYDRDGGNDSYEDFDMGRANDMFNKEFSQHLMGQWRPGLTVIGTLVTDGKRFETTIRPDGATEQKTTRVSGVVNYFTTTTVLASGGRIHNLHSFHLSLLLGRRLAALIVPDVVVTLPIVGHLTTRFVSWLPTIAIGCLVIRLLRGRPRVPGALPDGLADAFKLVGTEAPYG